VEALVRLHAARSVAEQVARDADHSKHARVRETAQSVRDEWHDATVKNVLAEARARWDKERSGQ
jgi:hypothetical protein